MNKPLALLMIAGLAAVGSASTQAQAPVQPDPIETRQAGQDLLSATFGLIRGQVAAKADVKTLELPAAAMARWMRQFPAQFPKGSETGHGSKATAAVWTDNAGFVKIANEFADNSDKLAQLAKAGDTDGVANQIKAVGDGCGACHRSFRAR